MNYADAIFLKRRICNMGLCSASNSESRKHDCPFKKYNCYDSEIVERLMKDEQLELLAKKYLSLEEGKITFK